MSRLSVLYEDNHLLVINKPAGIATMGAETGEPTVHGMAADYLRAKYNKPGKVFVGIVSRLDSMTTGVLVLARTSKAASRLTPQFADKSGSGAAKIYLTGLQGRLDQDHDTLTDELRKDDHARRMRVVGPNQPDSLMAQLQYLKLGADDDVTVVAARLLSGRKHQIRVQFADRGHPVLGDRKYGSELRFSSGISLHSWRLQITHPTLRERMWFEAPLPKSWNSLARLIPPAAKIREQTEACFGLPPSC